MKLKSEPTTAELLKSMGVDPPAAASSSPADLLAAFAAALSQLPASREELDRILADARDLLTEMSSLVARSESELAGLVNRQLERARVDLGSTAEQAAARVSGLEREAAATLSEIRAQEDAVRARLGELDALLGSNVADDRADSADLDALRGLVQSKVEEITAGFARLEEKLAVDLAEQKKQVDWRMRGVVSAPPTPTKIYKSGTLVGERRGLDFIPGTNTTLGVVDNGSDRVQVTINSPDYSGTYVALIDYEDSDVLAKIKNVDGSGSGLDADLLDGHDTAYFETPAGAQAKADAKVAETITNGVTGIAPSQDAVFDALALKAPLAPPWAALTAYKAGELVTKSGTLLSAKVDFTSGASFAIANWDVIAIPNQRQAFTSSGSYTVPDTVTKVRIVCVGAGSGGGGGGSALTAGGITNEPGGGGGGAGNTSIQEVTVTPGDVLTVTIGAGGAGGAGGAANSNAGVGGNGGGNTTVTGTGVSVTARGSSVGGRASAANSTAQANGGNKGQANSSSTSSSTPGVGGNGTSAGNQGNAGGPDGYAGGGGGGAGTATATLGGLGGNAGTLETGGTAGTNGGSGTAAGGNGVAAGANTGAGGGGGGGGAPGGAGGSGAAGGSGLAIIQAVG